MSIDVDYIIGDDVALVDGRRYVRESYLDEAKTENAKLRELVQELYEDQCDECDRWKYRDRMSELGVEI